MGMFFGVRLRGDYEKDEGEWVSEWERFMGEEKDNDIIRLLLSAIFSFLHID